MFKHFVFKELKSLSRTWPGLWAGRDNLSGRERLEHKHSKPEASKDSKITELHLRFKFKLTVDSNTFGFFKYYFLSRLLTVFKTGSKSTPKSIKLTKV